MRYQWHGETLMTDLVSALAALAYGGARAAYAINADAEKDAEKKANKLKLATLADAVVGAGGLIAKNYVGDAMAHEALEALGYAGFANLGQFAAAVYKKADTIPVWRPKEGESGSSGAQVVYYQPPVQYYQPAPVSVGPSPSSASILEI